MKKSVAVIFFALVLFSVLQPASATESPAPPQTVDLLHSAGGGLRPGVAATWGHTKESGLTESSGGVTSRIIDGSDSTRFYTSFNFVDTYVQVDLGQPRAITEVSVLLWSGYNNELYWRRDLNIKVSNDPDFSDGTVRTLGFINAEGKYGGKAVEINERLVFPIEDAFANQYRYIRVQKGHVAEPTSVVGMREISVTGYEDFPIDSKLLPQPLKNVALGKSAYQTDISGEPDYGDGWTDGVVGDGTQTDEDGNFSNAFGQYFGEDNQTYLVVDLGNAYPITALRINGSKNPAHLAEMDVYASNSPSLDGAALLGRITDENASAGPDFALQVQEAEPYRYIILTKTSGGAAYTGEITVWSDIDVTAPDLYFISDAGTVRARAENPGDGKVILAAYRNDVLTDVSLGDGEAVLPRTEECSYRAFLWRQENVPMTYAICF